MPVDVPSKRRRRHRRQVRRRQLRLTPELDVEPEFGSSDDDSVGGLVSLIARPTAADMKKSVVTEASSSHQKKRMKPMRK